MSNADWATLFEKCVTKQIGKRNVLVAQARRRLATNSSDDWDKLKNGLADPTLKWFVAEVFAKAPVPNWLFQAFLMAAINEPNPSLNRRFVDPCISSFGHRKVNGYLLDIVEQGNNMEIAGAVAALYWANMPIQFVGEAPEYTLDYATEESRSAYLELKDVWERKRELFFKTFINNDDVQVRRQILPSLNLKKLRSGFDDKFIDQVIEIARQHPDNYIRHRVEVQLGNERLLKPIPERTIDNEDVK